MLQQKPVHIQTIQLWLRLLRNGPSICSPEMWIRDRDMIPRYRTMKGYMVPRKAGWDTHGLPVELEVEKALGLDGKDQIEEYGCLLYTSDQSVRLRRETCRRRIS